MEDLIEGLKAQIIEQLNLEDMSPINIDADDQLFGDGLGLDSIDALERLRRAAINNENVFEELMHAVRYCSLGQITDTFFEVGGQYRRNM